MRTTLLGGLLDAARHNLARGAERVALFESGRVYLRRARRRRGGPLAASFPGERPAPDREPHRLAALAVGALRRGPGWRGRSGRADFFALKGVLEAWPARSASSSARRRRPSRSFTRRAAAVVLGGARGRLARRAPPAGRARLGTSSAAAGFELDLGRSWRRRPRGSEQYEDVITHPAVLQDLAVVGRRRRRGRDASAPRSREGGGELLRGAESSTSTAASRSATGRKSLALRLEFRAPDRTLTDEEVAERPRGGSRRRSPRSEGRCVSDGRRPVRRRRRRPGYAGALAASSSGAIRGSSSRAATVAQRRRARASTDLYPRYRCRSSSTELDLDALEDVDAAIVAYPHGAAAPVVAEMRGLGIAGRRPLGRLPARRRGDLRALVRRRTASPSCSRDAVYGLTELDRERDPRAPSWSPTPAAIRPRRCSRWRRSPSAG